LCHGYGPKPTWKDRGDKEKEEARKLRMQSRASRATSNSCIGEIVIHDALMSSPAENNPKTNYAELGSDVEEHTMSDTLFALRRPHDMATVDSSGESQATPAALDLSIFMEDLWFRSDDMATPISLSHHDKLDGELMALSPLTKPSHLGIGTPEHDIELLIYFMEDGFSRQYSLHKPSPISRKGWLMRLLLRSSTFYNASLSMSAYYLYLSQSNDTNARDVALKNYHEYRKVALQGFDRLESTQYPIHGDIIMCGVHIALLEVRHTRLT
jgi:hypothetical protein